MFAYRRSLYVDRACAHFWPSRVSWTEATANGPNLLTPL